MEKSPASFEELWTVSDDWAFWQVAREVHVVLSGDGAEYSTGAARERRPCLPGVGDDLGADVDVAGRAKVRRTRYRHRRGRRRQRCIQRGPRPGLPVFGQPCDGRASVRDDDLDIFDVQARFKVVDALLDRRQGPFEIRPEPGGGVGAVGEPGVRRRVIVGGEDAYPEDLQEVDDVASAGRRELCPRRCHITQAPRSIVVERRTSRGWTRSP